MYSPSSRSSSQETLLAQNVPEYDSPLIYFSPLLYTTKSIFDSEATPSINLKNLLSSCDRMIMVDEAFGRLNLTGKETDSELVNHLKYTK